MCRNPRQLSTPFSQELKLFLSERGADCGAGISPHNITSHLHHPAIQPAEVEAAEVELAFSRRCVQILLP